MDVQGNEKPQLSLGDNFSPGVCLSTSAVYGLTAAALRGHEALHISAMSYFEFMALAFFAALVSVASPSPSGWNALCSGF
jgi:hypothetical protein